MSRSFLTITENDFKTYENSLLFDADAIIIDVLNASCLYVNYEKYEALFKKLRQHQIKVYIKMDITQLKQSCRLLDYVDGSTIDGLFIDQALPKYIRRFSLKAREYEVKQKLAFKSLKFIIQIQSIKQVNRLQRMLKSSRVEAVVYQPFAHPLEEKIAKKVKQMTWEYHKELIDEHQLTNEVTELKEINHLYHLNQKQIEESLLFVEKLSTLPKNEQIDFTQNNSISHHLRVLKTAKRLKLITNYPHIPLYVNKKKEKILKNDMKIKRFYTLGEEIANGVSHGVGALLAIVGLILLIIKATTPLEYASFIVFGLSAIILYMMSTLYHSLSLGKLAKTIFQRFDHMSIYILIAGTYTPFSLLGLGGSLGIGMCIFLWSVAFFGLMLNLFAFRRYHTLHVILYVAMGWVAIFFIPDIVAAMDLGGIILLIAGGVAYTMGILFYAFKWFKFTHMVWHIMTIIGTILHFFAIYYFLG